MLSTIDESHTDLIVVDYPYFDRSEPMIFHDGGTYVETDAELGGTMGIALVCRIGTEAELVRQAAVAAAPGSLSGSDASGWGSSGVHAA